jgi:hypothetical protein
MNTRIHYMYRDASNYKKHTDIVVAGVITFDQIKDFLQDDEFFIAGDVGLSDLQTQWGDEGYKFSTEDDHVFSELSEEDFEPTEDAPTVGITAGELLANFVRIGGKWDVAAAMGRMGLTE